MSNDRPGIVVNFIIRMLYGIAMIFFVNYFLTDQGINLHVGLNPVSVLTSGVLGIPGVAAMYGILLTQFL